MEKTNAERFLNAYAEIEKRMAEICGSVAYMPFSSLLLKCAQKDLSISVNQENLREYHELRNAIVHMRGPDNEIIAEPSDSVTLDIERIAALLEKTGSVMHYASQPVRTVSPDEQIEAAYALMEQLDTAKIPVYENGVYQGLLTLEAIARWGIRGNIEKRTVKDMLYGAGTDRVVFISRTESVKTVVNAYHESMQKGRLLFAVIITEHGKRTEKPAGIIALADLPRIIGDFI